MILSWKGFGADPERDWGFWGENVKTKFSPELFISNAIFNLFSDLNQSIPVHFKKYGPWVTFSCPKALSVDHFNVQNYNF